MGLGSIWIGIGDWNNDVFQGFVLVVAPLLCYHIMWLVGLMIGSLYVIWPFQDREYSESVRSEQVEFNDPIILELQAYPESTRKPEYKKLGPTSNSSEKVEILTVKQKLIHSEPFIPFWSKADSDERLNDGRNSIIYSVVMMLVGIGVIIMIFLLERRKLTSKQTESS